MGKLWVFLWETFAGTHCWQLEGIIWIISHRCILGRIRSGDVGESLSQAQPNPLLAASTASSGHGEQHHRAVPVPGCELISPSRPWDMLSLGFPVGQGFIPQLLCRTPVSAYPDQTQQCCEPPGHQGGMRLLLALSLQPPTMTWVYRAKTISEGWLDGSGERNSCGVPHPAVIEEMSPSSLS